MTNQSQSSACLQQAQNQHDLIKLLAQHFNQQVYQMAGASTSTELGSAIRSSSASSTANNIDMLHQGMAHLQKYQQQQQQQQHNQANQDFSPLKKRVDMTSAAGLLAMNSNDQPFPPGRSHNLPAGSLSIERLSTSSPGSRRQLDATPLSGTSYQAAAQQLGNQTLNPLLNDMNLFNALNCFSLTNDQFMLSLQQQYLIQAASMAGKHHGFKQNLNTSVGLEVPQRQQLPPHQQQFGQFIQNGTQLKQQQQHDLQANQRSRRNQFDQSGGHRGTGLNAQSYGGRELLKFSINTILGCGSPVAVSNQEPSESRSPEAELDLKFEDKSSNSASSQHRPLATRNHRSTSSPSCDPNVLTDSSDNSNSDTPFSEPTNLASSFANYQPPSVTSVDLNPRATSLIDQVARYQQAAASVEHQQRSSLVNQNSNQHQSSLTFLSGSSAFPWTAAARGKPRRGMMRRAVFSDSQRVGLEKRFQLQKYISKPDRKKLAEKLGLRDSQVKIWFQNRRMKWRNSKERELLSAGGSREQTLPTRNNPNPDLSDVGETIKKLSSTPNGNTTA